MNSIKCPLPPSSSLPPLRAICTLTEIRLLEALQNLSAIYCPLPVTSLSSNTLIIKSAGDVTPSPIDSGYASETEDEVSNPEDKLAVLRANDFERTFSERWLTGFIARIDELSCFDTEDAQEQVTNLAYCVLEALCCPLTKEEDEPETDFGRTFSFTASLPNSSEEGLSFDIQLNDGLAGMNDTDPDDVGLQSWGASIVFSRLLCNSLERFGLEQPVSGPGQRIIELGAGTGLVSLVLGKILQNTTATITATDYHPAVLTNLRSNVALNFPDNSQAVETASLDWSSPTLEPPFDVPADVLVATDAVYGLDHAIWLRGCASRLLAPDGIFWLLLTIRENGKFEEIAKSVDLAFPTAASALRNGQKSLAILDAQMIPKVDKIGRADESGYRLYKIGWV